MKPVIRPRNAADELQLRCAWVRLRRKASAKVLKNPARWRDILDRVAMDEAKTLRAIGGKRLADAVLRAYEAAEPMEILEREVGFVVRVEGQGLPVINEAPSLANMCRRRQKSLEGPALSLHELL